jgi:hypothetical protein
MKKYFNENQNLFKNKFIGFLIGLLLVFILIAIFKSGRSFGEWFYQITH